MRCADRAPLPCEGAALAVVYQPPAAPYNSSKTFPSLPPSHLIIAHRSILNAERPPSPIMSKHNILRQLSRASTTAIRPPTTAFARHTTRPLSHSAIRREKDSDEKVYDSYTTTGELGHHIHEGQHSRTDNTIRIEHPDEEDLPRQGFAQGRGGYHFKRTLASFSLEDRVGVVTGGARGLGLTMSQALLLSGMVCPP